MTQIKLGANLGLQTRVVRANNTEFGLLEIGGPGPLALCLHGFPDSAYTWRHLLPELAKAGFHAVAPFMRGYAPSAIPGDRNYSLGALICDVLALHDVLGGDDQAVLVGHDWGAEAAYGAVALDPHRWRRLVTLAVPPMAQDERLFRDFEQIKRFFYLWLFKASPSDAADIIAADDMAFLDRLWREWSPGYDPSGHLRLVKSSIRERGNLEAAISYYSGITVAAADSRSGRRRPSAYELAERAARRRAERPTLYLHGRMDGCISSRLVGDALQMLGRGSRLSILDGVGHFLHLEEPVEVNKRILSWLTG